MSSPSKKTNKVSAEATGFPHWTLHDLRRTARSLMARAGVLSEHAEQVLGHAIGGVEETYNRHKYEDEKAAALARLANLIESIVNPQAASDVGYEQRTSESPFKSNGSRNVGKVRFRAGA